MVFPLNKPLGYESSYYRMSREKEIRYLVARKGDWIFHLTGVKKIGSLICVDAALTRVVWHTSKPWQY